MHPERLEAGVKTTAMFVLAAGSAEVTNAIEGTAGIAQVRDPVTRMELVSARR